MESKDLLKEKKLKITTARIETLNILSQSENTLCAEDIYHICLKNSIDINLSTIYRTLDLFCEKEIIEKIISNDKVFSYKLKSLTHRHYLKCDICHREVEIQCPMLQIAETVEHATGFTLTEHNLKLKGICPECKNKYKK